MASFLSFFGWVRPVFVPINQNPCVSVWVTDGSSMSLSGSDLCALGKEPGKKGENGAKCFHIDQAVSKKPQVLTGTTPRLLRCHF